MLRVIAEVKPKWVVAENVPGLLTIENGMVFESILADLENQDYEVQTFIIPALAVDAPHKRNRLWIVANSNGSQESQSKRFEQIFRQRISDGDIDIADAESICLQRYNERQREKQFWGGSASGDWFEVATALCGVDYGIPRQLDRNKRIKALGNAIVPQIAYNIFQAILNS